MSITSPPRAETARSRSAAGARARRVLLLLHQAAGLGWLGVTTAFVALTVWLLDVRDPSTVRTGYAVHELLVVWVARPAAIGVAATGLLLTMTARRRTPRWWLWWVPAKLVLVVATVVVTVGVSPAALRFAVDHADTVGSPAYAETQHALVLVAIYHVVMICAAALLAITRPGAPVRRGPRAEVAS